MMFSAIETPIATPRPPVPAPTPSATAAIRALIVDVSLASIEMLPFVLSTTELSIPAFVFV